MYPQSSPDPLYKSQNNQRILLVVKDFHIAGNRPYCIASTELSISSQVKNSDNYY